MPAAVLGHVHFQARAVQQLLRHFAVDEVVLGQQQPRAGMVQPQLGLGRGQPRRARAQRLAAAQRVTEIEREIIRVQGEVQAARAAGNQEATADRSKLAYGVSITDGCIGWEETEELLLEAHGRLA